MNAERFLVDTHTCIWMQANDARLSSKARAILGDSSNRVFVSAVTCWEIAIKFRLGKLDVPLDFASDVEGTVLRSGLTGLPITFPHAQRTSSLPYFHRDPFDRLLIAQALVEGMILISRDGKFDPYGVERVW